MRRAFGRVGGANSCNSRAIGFIATSAFSIFEATFALFAEHRFSLGSAGVAAVFVGIGLGLVAVQGGAIRPVTKAIGPQGTLRAGLMINVVGLLLLAASKHWAVLVPALVLLVAGQGLAAPSLTATVAQVSDPSSARRGAGFPAGRQRRRPRRRPRHGRGAVPARGSPRAVRRRGGDGVRRSRPRLYVRDLNRWLPVGNLRGMPPSDFSLHLNEDQLQIQKWVHDFAEDVVRPAADEWDEREEFPWPIVQEAAKIGLYGFDFMANAMIGDPTGLTLPVAIEELFWGDAGIGLAIFGSGLAAAGIAGNGTPEQVMEWVPQCYGTPDDVEARRVLRERARRRLRRVVAAHPGRLRRGQGRVGAQRHQGVDHQRRHRRRPRGRRRRSTPTLKGRGPGQLRRAAGHAGPVAGPEVQEARHPGVAHRRGRARRRARARAAACSAARRSSTRSWPGPARRRPHRASKQPAMATFEATRPAVGAQAIGIARAAYEYALDYAKERKAFGKPIIMNQAIAFMLADMATEIDAARLLVWRAAWLARNGGYTNAEGSMSKLKAGRSRRVGHRAGHPDPRRLRLHPRVPRRALAPRRQDLHIFEGTEQIQQLVIARAITGLRIE